MAKTATHMHYTTQQHTIKVQGSTLQYTVLQYMMALCNTLDYIAPYSSTLKYDSAAQ